MATTDIVLDYLMANYYDDVERVAHIKAVQYLVTKQDLTPQYAANIIDKCCLFNGIKKSYEPTAVDIQIAVRKFIKGINFILYKDEDKE